MIELGKKYRTRDGREVRIYAVDGGGIFPVHGSILQGEGWTCEMWRDDGGYRTSAAESSKFDLIEVRPEVTVRRYAYLIQSGEVALLMSSVPLDAAWRKIGAIDITHDGEKLIKVEVVK